MPRGILIAVLTLAGVSDLAWINLSLAPKVWTPAPGIATRTADVASADRGQAAGTQPVVPSYDAHDVMPPARGPLDDELARNTRESPADIGVPDEGLPEGAEPGGPDDDVEITVLPEPEPETPAAEPPSSVAATAKDKEHLAKATEREAPPKEPEVVAPVTERPAVAPPAPPEAVVPKPAARERLREPDLDILFLRAGSASLSPEAEAALAALVEQLKNDPEAKVEIRATADNRSSRAEARQTAERRAMVVTRFLRRHGIKPSRIHTIEPTPPFTESGAGARRVDLTILPKGTTWSP